MTSIRKEISNLKAYTEPEGTYLDKRVTWGKLKVETLSKSLYIL